MGIDTSHVMEEVHLSMATNKNLLVVSHVVKQIGAEERIVWQYGKSKLDLLEFPRALFKQCRIGSVANQTLSGSSVPEENEFG